MVGPPGRCIDFSDRRRVLSKDSKSLTQKNAEQWSNFGILWQVFMFRAKTQRGTPDHGKSLRLCGRNQSFGVRGFALSPEAVAGNGGKLSPSFGAAIDVVPCRLTSSNLLNSANSLSASSFCLSRE